MQGDAADGSCHPLDRQLQSRLRHGLRRSDQPPRHLSEEVLNNRHIRWKVASRTKNRRELIRPQTTEQKVGIGDRQRTTGAITGRSGTGSCGAWADPQLQPVGLKD